MLATILSASCILGILGAFFGIVSLYGRGITMHEEDAAGAENTAGSGGCGACGNGGCGAALLPEERRGAE